MNDKQLAELFCPWLCYDSQAAYFAVSPATLTSNPGNTLTRKGEVVASASGVPMLSLAFLKDRADDEKTNKDKLVTAPDHLAAASSMQADSRYANCAYWRVKRSDKRIFIQYWLCFYYVPLDVIRDVRGRAGTWRLIQVEVSQGDEPVPRSVYAGRSGGVLPWGGVERRDDTHPLLFVAPFTQKLYFHSGPHRRGLRFDGSDGAVRKQLRLERFRGWQRWMGTWGGASRSQKSPVSLKEWDDPVRVMRAGRWASLRGQIARRPAGTRLLEPPLRRARRLLSACQSETPAEPKIDARLERGRVMVRYELEGTRPSRLHLTVHANEQVIAAETITRLEHTGETFIDLPDKVESCDVLATGIAMNGRRSSPDRVCLTVNSPDKLEQAVFKSVLDAQLRAGEARRYSTWFKVGPMKISRAVKGASDKIWTTVASDLQAFRDARSANVQCLRARKTKRKATVLCVACGALTSAFVVAVGATFAFDPETAGLILVVGWSYALIAALVAVRQWRERAKAIESLRRWPDPAPEDEAAPLTAARRIFERALGERAIAPAIRTEINRAARTRYDDPLDFGHEGLPELRVREYEVSTRARKVLDELTDRMRGASIGIAGPRGAGKSTLIKSYCEPRDPNDRRLTTVLAAPVKYDARDFVLTLFGQLCEEVLDRPPGIPPAAQAPTRLAKRVRIVVPAGLGAIALGLMAVLAVKAAGPLSLDVAIVGVALLIGLAGLWRIMRLAHRARTRAKVADPEQRLRERAERELDDIRFQQSWSSGYSGKLSVPLPLSPEMALTQSQDATARQATFPQIVRRLRSFLALAATARGEVVIGIDEMDKMETGEIAKQFLNEIKAIFGVDNCFYLVSISESAMSTFEQRGLPFRDVFDSSFDEVVTVAPLTLGNSKDLLQRRVVGLGPPFLDLCHCLAGGLPRDVLRAARRLSVYEGDRELRAVCKKLAIAELQRKVEAASVSARQVALEPHVSELLSWLRDLCPPDASSRQLLQRSAAMPANWQDTPRSGNGDGDRTEPLEQIRRELAAFTYYLATVVQFFAEFPGEARVHFERAEAGEREGTSEIDRLALARAAFEVSPGLAISMIDAFRRRRRWRTVCSTVVSDGAAGLSEARPGPVVPTGNGSS